MQIRADFDFFLWNIETFLYLSKMQKMDTYVYYIHYPALQLANHFLNVTI